MGDGLLLLLLLLLLFGAGHIFSRRCWRFKIPLNLHNYNFCQSIPAVIFFNDQHDEILLFPLPRTPQKIILTTFLMLTSFSTSKKTCCLRKKRIFWSTKSLFWSNKSLFGKKKALKMKSPRLKSAKTGKKSACGSERIQRQPIKA